MSNQDKTDETQAAETEAASDAPDVEAVTEPDVGDEIAEAADGSAEEAPGEEHAAPEPEAEAPARSQGSGGVAWIALFLALSGVAAIGYSLVQDWRAEKSARAGADVIGDSIGALGSRIDSADGSLSDLSAGLAELSSTNAGLSSEIEGLREQIDQRLTMLDSLPPRMTDLEAALASLKGVSAGARETWLIAEAEYYMQIANAQLQLAGNAELALIALRAADERILQLANPALIDVRRALANELAALEALDKPDIEGATLTLASLARVAASLPLRRYDAGNGPEAAAADEAGSIDRLWSSVKGAFSELVKVTPPEQAKMPLIAPEAEYFLRTNLSLQLQAARLALLRGERAVFEQSLDDASMWMHEHFDRQSPQVTSALQTISEIRDSMITVASPDISQSLRLLRQYKTLSESEQ